MNHDRLRLVAGVIDDLDLPGLDNDELEVLFPDRNDVFSVPVPAAPGISKAAELGNLALIKCREGDGLEVVFGHSGLTPLH